MRSALGPDARVEHVGSTSVPGLVAKPVVDVQVAVPSLARWEDYGPALEGLGYRFRGDEDPEHLFFFLDEDGERRMNVHVCEAGSNWERRHLAFRDRLRTHPEEAAVYLEVKRRAAALVGDDVHAYAAAKTPIVRRIERRALGERPPLRGPDPDGPDVGDPVEVVPYDPAWPGAFEEAAAGVRSALGGRVLRLEHVGFTAVPGMAAEPLIDLLLSPRDWEPEAAWTEPLEALGYRRHPDQRLVPASGPDRRLLLARAPDRRLHARGPDRRLHAVRAGSEDERRALALRRHLRASPEQAERLGRLQAILAGFLRNERRAYEDAMADYLWVIEQRVQDEALAGGPGEEGR
jgi:GrpB-like predicted nucleotidyltransferase (UPF0157 family)